MAIPSQRLARKFGTAAKVCGALVLAIGLSGCYAYPYGYYGNGYYSYGYYPQTYYRPYGPYAYQPYRPYYYYP